MQPASTDTVLTLGQRAAVARLAFAVESPAAVALLCGPPGVGKTLVLTRLAEASALGGRHCVRHALGAGLPGAAGATPAGNGILLVDDAHRAATGDLAEMIHLWRCREPRGGIVLAGAGRLLTLISRDVRVERDVVLRAALGPFTLAESRRVVTERGVPPGADVDDDVVRTIHEIAAGIPAQVVRLADLVQVGAAAAPTGRATVADVESLHRRLSPRAA